MKNARVSLLTVVNICREVNIRKKEEEEIEREREKEREKETKKTRDEKNHIFRNN